jgi:NlpE C-terminal OB domain
LRRFRGLAVWFFLAGCAQPPGAPVAGSDGGAGPLARLPATFENVPSCPDCLRVTLTLRPDGSYAVRERLASSEFYDFGRWQVSRPEGLLLLEGGRFETLHYLPRSPDTLGAQTGVQGDLKRRPEVEKLRGPFRLTGLYDGATFKDCRTGLAWPVDDSQAGGGLKREYLKTEAGMEGKPALVAIDARFDEEGTVREEVHIQRTPTILPGTACPGPQVN